MTELTAAALPGLLADPRRSQVLAAVALGARTPSAVAAATGLPGKDVATALHRLAGLVVAADAGLEVAYGALRSLAEQAAPDDGGDPSGLDPFVRGDRLVSLPAQPARRLAVLAHVAARALEEGVAYDETAVNARLAPWCEGGQVDHAALRRYLVESGLVSRGGGTYRRGGQPPEPGAGERRVEAMGLR